MLMVLATLAAPLGAADAVQQPTPAAAQAYAFSFQDAELPLVAEEVLGHALGVSFTIDPSVTAKVTFRVDRRMTKLELLSVFETAMAASDVVLVRNGENFVLTTRQKARGTAGVGGLPNRNGGYSVVSIPLSNARPSEISKALKSMGGPDVVVLADDEARVLMLGGTAREIENARETIS
jgi:general secretion pathway protein D